MAVTVCGTVKDGKVVVDSPLPEGARVAIIFPLDAPELTRELQAELEAWGLASAHSLELVEQLAKEMEDETR